MYIVIGGGGFLGSWMIKNILAHTEENVLAAARHSGRDWGTRVVWAQCDISSMEEIDAFVKAHSQQFRGAKILYLAAYHQPDLVEQNPKLAWHINVTALSYFLNALPDDISSFYYPSSDSVYGESVDHYRFREDDSLNPVNRYGRQKCVAEQLVTGYGHHVVRFPFLISPSLVPNRPHFYDRIVETLRAGKPIDMLVDSCRSVISFDTAAILTISLLEHSAEVPQILNVCGDRAYSKYEIGRLIADQLGVSDELIRPVSIKDDSGIFTTKRAESTLMDNSRIKEILGLKEIMLVL